MDARGAGRQATSLEGHALLRYSAPVKPVFPMKLNKLKTTDLELTDAMRAAVEHMLEKLGKYAARYGEAVSADVELAKTTRHHRKGPFFRAEINVEIPGKLLRAESEHEDLYAAIEEVEDEMTRQLREEKERSVDSRRGE